MNSTLETVGQLIKRAQDRNHRNMDAMLAPIDLTLVQWNALREIHRNPDASQHRLAELTFNSDQAFGTLITRLIKRDLLQREQGPGRAIRHRLTELGETRRAAGQVVLAQVLEESFAALDGEELEALAALLKKLLAGRPNAVIE